MFRTIVRRWTLNDEIQHHKHGFVPEAAVKLELSFQKSKSKETPVIPVTTLLLDMQELLRSDLVYEAVHKGEKGFRLRFVHDPSDHRIYIQRPPKDAPRRFVAEVPTGL